MSLTFQLRKGEFERSIRDYTRASKKDAAQVVKDQTRLAVKEAIKLTPPMGPAPIKESFGKQRKVGVAAVKRDVGEAFKHVSKLDVFKDPISESFGKVFRRFVRQGNTGGVESLLSKIKFKNPQVAVEASESLIRSKRRSRGRLKAKSQHFVLKARSITQLLRTLLSRVGFAKSGWPHVRAGVKVPKWIGKHESKHLWVNGLKGPKGPSITFGNKVPYIQKIGAELNIMKAVFRFRSKQMKLQAERLFSKRARRSNA